MNLALILNIGGLLLLIAGPCTPAFLHRVAVQERPAPWRRLWGWRWELGILLALLSVFSGTVAYPETIPVGKYFMMGIPFVVGSGTYGEKGELSVITNYTFPMNFVFWLFFPQLVLWLTSGRRRGRDTDGPANGPAT